MAPEPTDAVRLLPCPYCGTYLPLSADICLGCGAWVPIGAHEVLTSPLAPESR